MQMVMVDYVRIKSFGPAVDLDDVQDADFRKCQQGAVDRVERNVRVLFFDSLIDASAVGCLSEINNSL